VRILFTHNFPFKNPHRWISALCTNLSYNMIGYMLTPRTLSSIQKTEPTALTGYRLLIILLTAIFGLSKAGLSYNGQSTASTTLDWMYGAVVFALCVHPCLCYGKFEHDVLFKLVCIGLGFTRNIHRTIWDGSSKTIICRCSGGSC
jgi:hypothetical protein